MSGKKFMGWFALSVVLTGIGISMWIKHGYDTRPNIEIQKEQQKMNTQPEAAPSEAAPESKY